MTKNKIIIALVVLLAIAGGVFAFVSNNNSKNTQKSSSSSISSRSSNSVSSSTSITSSLDSSVSSTISSNFSSNLASSLSPLGVAPLAVKLVKQSELKQEINGTFPVEDEKGKLVNCGVKNVVAYSPKDPEKSNQSLIISGKSLGIDKLGDDVKFDGYQNILDFIDRKNDYFGNGKDGAKNVDMLLEPFANACNGFASKHIIELVGVELKGVDKQRVVLAQEGQDVCADVSLRGYAYKGDNIITFSTPAFSDDNSDYKKLKDDCDKLSVKKGSEEDFQKLYLDAISTSGLMQQEARENGKKMTDLFEIVS